jgi:DUF1365 family protein
MTDCSALYIGSVMHQRLKPRTHRFRYRGFWLLLDLDELAQTGFGLTVFSHNRFNLFSYHDSDHGDRSDTPLRKQIERTVAEAGIGFTNGSIRLLCMPRTLGYSFNPVSIYFCAHADGTPAAAVYEVHNTYGERHSYTIPAKTGASIEPSCNKAFYVSPFLDMDLRYNFSASEPGDKLAVSIRASKCGKTVMVASLAGKRRALTNAMLLRLFFSMPAITLKVIAAIHWEAMRLWLKGLRFHPHTSEDISIPDPLPTPHRKNV